MKFMRFRGSGVYRCYVSWLRERIFGRRRAEAAAWTQVFQGKTGAYFLHAFGPLKGPIIVKARSLHRSAGSFENTCFPKGGGGCCCNFQFGILIGHEL